MIASCSDLMMVMSSGGAPLGVPVLVENCADSDVCLRKKKRVSSKIGIVV